MPTLHEAFSKTCHEESRWKSTLGPSSIDPLSEGYALSIHHEPLSASPMFDHSDSLTGNTSQSLNMSPYILILRFRKNQHFKNLISGNSKHLPYHNWNPLQPLMFLLPLRMNQTLQPHITSSPNRPLHVYARMKQHEKDSQTMPPTDSAEPWLDLLVNIQGLSQGIPSLTDDDSPEIEHDDELPIALRKDVRSCTQHSIVNLFLLRNYHPLIELLYLD